MRVPLEWLSSIVDTSSVDDPHALAADFASIGLEEEEYFGPEVTGPLVVGRVLTREPEEHSNGKTVNWCSVDVGEGEPRGIICGAHNFDAGDLIVAALPGAVLPGGFAISARKTYGHISDGMICSTKELGLGEDHDGIMVLSDFGLDAAPGDDALPLLGLDRVTLDVNVTPDRGYQLSMRGIGREFAMLTGQEFSDPAAAVAAPEHTDGGYPVELADDVPIRGAQGCTRFTALTVTGIDPTAKTPYWMQRRLQEAGMRPISLAVDITNYVMLELGQPLHAYDAEKLGEKIVVRRAQAGETMTTLDDMKRTLDPEDLLITDVSAGASRPIGIAGVMGGADTEVSESTTSVIVEAAHFDQVTIARSARRHKLPSEAARRFERGVDPALGPAAARRAAELLVEFAGGEISDAATVVGDAPAPRTLSLGVTAPTRRVGVEYGADEVARLLRAVGCEVDSGAGEELSVTVPTWRPDLTSAEDLIEEVARAGGYDRIPSVLPQAPGGLGLTAAQRMRRRVSNLLAASGFSEVLTYPFTSDARADEMLLPADDVRRSAVRLVNPMADDRPLMRTSLLATLVDAHIRNIGRGFKDVAVFEAGLVSSGVGQRTVGKTFDPGVFPSEEELAEVFASVPAQPYHVAGIASGHAELPGATFDGRRFDALDVIDLVRRIAFANGISVEVRSDDLAPFHPGRCARFELSDGTLVGHAGELHPKAIENLGLPVRTVAFEIDLDALLSAADERTWAGVLSTYPVSRQDVALVVDADLPAATLTKTLRDAAGSELEAVEVFDVYDGDQVPDGKKSLACRLTFRAADRTLTADEASALRTKATEAAAAAHGAVVRS